MRMRHAIILAALLLAAALPAAGQPPELTLIPQFAEGERVRYRMQLNVVTDSSLIPQGGRSDDQALRLAIDMTWQLEVLEVATAGGARLCAVIEDLSMETSGRPAPAPVEDFIGKPVTYRLKDDGSVADIQAPDEWLENGRPPVWLQTWLRQGSGSPTDLPAEPVSPGQVWRNQRDFQVAGLPTQHLVSESEYLRDEVANGRPCAAVLTRFELGGADTHTPEELATAAEIARRVEGGGSRLSCYDHRSGRLLQSSQKSREHIRLEIYTRPRAGSSEPSITLESTTTTDSQLNLVE